MNKTARDKSARPKIAIGAAATLVVLGSLASLGSLGGAAVADTPTRTHTIKGHLIESSDWGWQTGYVALDDDFNAENHQLASDVTTCRAARPTAHKATCDAALAFRKGLVVVRFVESTRPGPIHGRVLSGTGRFHGARGTITIREGNNGDGPSTARWTLKLRY